MRPGEAKARDGEGQPRQGSGVWMRDVENRLRPGIHGPPTQRGHCCLI